MKRLECLDGLRGVLALYVLLTHMAPFGALPAWIVWPLSHGEAGVPNVAASLGTDYVEVDLLTAARWLSDWPPPKDATRWQCRLLFQSHQCPANRGRFES